MSQPNLQLLGGSGHGGSHFAFMGGAPRGGGLPSSPPRFGGESVLGGMAGSAGGAGHASLGDRRMSHPSLPAMFSSPPQRPPSSSPESMSAVYQQVCGQPQVLCHGGCAVPCRAVPLFNSWVVHWFAYLCGTPNLLPLQVVLLASFLSSGGVIAGLGCVFLDLAFLRSDRLLLTHGCY